MTDAYLMRDRVEKFNLKRGWFVTAWRLVDESGKDLVQPWFDSKRGATEYAKSRGIAILKELS